MRSVQSISDERGMLLLGAIFLSTLTMLLITVGLTRTFTDMRASTIQIRKAQTFHLAEAGVDAAIVAVKRHILLAGQFPPTLADVPPAVVGGYTVSPTVLYEGNMRSEPVNASLTGMRQFQGMNALVRDVKIHSNVAGVNGTLTRLEAAVRFHMIPVFQFAEYDWNDWTFTPGPEMVITGPIHANGSIALGPDTGLTIDGTVNAVEEFVHILPGTGYVNIKGSDGNYYNMRNGDGSWLESIDANGMADIASRWGEKVKAHAAAVNLPMPTDSSGNPINPITLIQPYNPLDTVELRNAKYFYQADLRIKNGNMLDANGMSLGPLPAGVVTTVSFYDAREGQNMCITEVDLAALQAQNLLPDADNNGRILYVESDQLACKNGVRIKNGAQLPVGGLTIATHNPLYVIGNYNVTQKKAASLVADAVTVLSSVWNDANGTRTTSQRVATSTTLNAALMTSRARQPKDNVSQAERDRLEAYLAYGPASEHMIRFLEDWAGRIFTFTGSEVSPWDSHEATSDLACCGDGGAYRPPRRIWAFDTTFLSDINALPPGTPRVYVAASVAWRELTPQE